VRDERLGAVKRAGFRVMLTSEDRYRHEHIRMKKEVLGFVVQYETRVAGQWLPVIRYDTRHGFAHRDLLDVKGNKRKRRCLHKISAKPSRLQIMIFSQIGACTRNGS